MEKLKTQRSNSNQAVNGQSTSKMSTPSNSFENKNKENICQNNTNINNGSEDISLAEILEDAENSDMDVDIDEQTNFFEGTASAADVLSLVEQNKKISKVTGSDLVPLKDPKSYSISCKQCRWTLRKWEGWAKKRNAGKSETARDGMVMGGGVP